MIREQKPQPQLISLKSISTENYFSSPKNFFFIFVVIPRPLEEKFIETDLQGMLSNKYPALSNYPVSPCAGTD